MLRKHTIMQERNAQQNQNIKGGNKSSETAPKLKPLRMAKKKKNACMKN